MQIIDRLLSLRRREHDATVALIQALVECHRTKAHVDAGYPTVFQLLVQHLHYSPAAASRRFAAMRCALRSPHVIEILRAHRTSLTSLAKIASVLDDVDDPTALLRSIDGLGPHEVEATVAAMRPLTKPVERVRTVAVIAAAKPATDDVGTLWGSSAVEAEGRSETSCSAERGSERNADNGSEPASRSATELRTMNPAPKPTPRIALYFTLTDEAHAAFERARAKLGRTRYRPLSLEETVNALVHHFHAHEGTARRTCAESKSTRVAKPRIDATQRTRHIPHTTRESVLARDGHRCSFVAPDGTRCLATHDLQIDHVVPFARGGTNDAENLRTLCGAHNRRLGEVEFGVLR